MDFQLWILISLYPKNLQMSDPRLFGGMSFSDDSNMIKPILIPQKPSFCKVICNASNPLWLLICKVFLANACDSKMQATVWNIVTGIVYRFAFPKALKFIGLRDLRYHNNFV